MLVEDSQATEEVTYLWVAETVLRKHGRPLKAREIVSYGIEDGLFPERGLSRTPQNSMQARLSMDILRKGPSSKFLRTGRGLFFLRDLREGLQRGGSARLDEYTALRRTPLPASENVLVIGRAGYRNILDFQGIDVLHAERLRSLLTSRELTYLPRTAAETDNDYKQFITYTIIQNQTRILCFRRGQYNRAASFLRGALCIGFGGHVTEDDFNLLTLEDRGIRANAAREIREEIRFKHGRPLIEPRDIEVLGVLNDDSSDVGVRHLAIVLRFWAPSGSGWEHPVRGEASVSQLRWLDLRTGDLNLLEFEYWSQLCLRRFYAPAVTAKPSYRIVRKKPFQQDHILCVVGAIGSGKSIATRCLQQQAGYVEVNSGRVLAQLLGIAPVPETPRSEFQDRAQMFIADPSGPTKLAEAMIREAERSGSPKVIIDGIRHPETLYALRNKTRRPVAVLYIHTPPDVAYELYTVRDPSQENLSPADFMAIFNAPVESRVRYLIDDADAVLYNWFGIESYRFAVQQLIRDLGLHL